MSTVTIAPEMIATHLRAMTTAGLAPASIDARARVAHGTTATALSDPGAITVTAARQILDVPRPAPAQHVLGRLVAAGYPLMWLATEHPDAHAQGFRALIAGKAVDLSVANAVHDLCSQIGDRVATTASGLNARQIERAKQWGKANGYHPPAMYEDDNLKPVRVKRDHVRTDKDYEDNLDELWEVLVAVRRHGPSGAAHRITHKGSFTAREGFVNSCLKGVRKQRLCRESDPGGTERLIYLIGVLNQFRAKRLGSAAAVSIAIGDLPQLGKDHPARAEAAELRAQGIVSPVERFPLPRATVSDAA